MTSAKGLGVSPDIAFAAQRESTVTAASARAGGRLSTSRGVIPVEKCRYHGELYLLKSIDITGVISVNKCPYQGVLLVEKWRYNKGLYLPINKCRYHGRLYLLTSVDITRG